VEGSGHGLTYQYRSFLGGWGKSRRTYHDRRPPGCDSGPSEYEF